MRRLLYVACFTWICPLRLPSLSLNHYGKIKHCIKDDISIAFVFQLYCLSTTEAFTIAVSTLQAGVTVAK